MKKKTKTLILSIVVTLILLLTFTVTYAVFTYQGTTSNQQLVLGDIYMHYTESNAISISGALPGDPYDSSDPNNYFEFTISGKNTYKQKDIYYDVILSRGETPDDKTEANRIGDEYLKFRLVEVNEDDTETELFTDKTYSDLTNKRIWVETISKNTTTEYNKTYRIYMVISENLIIGNTTDSVMTTEAYKDAFASIKVNVTGDFNEKVLTYEDMYNVTDASCFETREEYTYTHNTNMTEEELNVCVTYLNSFEVPANEGETLETFCKGTGTYLGYTFQETLNDNNFSFEMVMYFKENNIIMENVGVSITGYDQSCGTDLVIPKTINGMQVVRISGSSNYFEASFYNKNLTSVVIPNSVIIIEYYAFYENQLTSVTFEENSKLDSIYGPAFAGIDSNPISEVTIPNSVTYLDCEAFNDDVIIHKSDSLTCTHVYA